MSGITSLFQYDFMRNAFLAVLIITPLFGILGTMIVNNKMAFFSDALGHSALTGIAVGVVCGIPDTNLSMVIFGIAFALLLTGSKVKVPHRRIRLSQSFLPVVSLSVWQFCPVAAISANIPACW